MRAVDSPLTPQPSTAKRVGVGDPVGNEKVAHEIDSERRGAPRKCYAATAVSIVVNKKFAAESLCIDDKAAGPVRSQPDNLPNHSISSDFHGREMALRVEGDCRTRGHQRRARSQRTAKKIASVETCIHGYADYADLKK